MGDMIERASEILDYVGGDGCQVVGHTIDFGRVVNALTTLRVLFDGDCIRIGLIEIGQPKLKVMEVSFGPCDFCLDAVEHGAHGQGS